MIRWLILVVVVIVLSTVATVALQWAPSALSDTTIAAPVIAKRPDGPAPLAEVEQSMTHAFGSMAQQVIGTHVFKVRNAGKADLLLENAGTTCKCTIANLGKDGEARVKPGDDIDIRLEWNTKLNSGHFVQTATVKTNDPLHASLVFTIDGEVQPPTLMYPPDPIVQLSNLPNDQGGGSYRDLVSPDRPGFKISEARSSRPELLQGSVEPLTPEQAANYKATTGQRILVQIKPSHLVGPFKEEILLRSDHPLQPEMRLVVMGRLMGPINTAPDEIRLPNVLGTRGATALLSLYVRGQAETHFTVEKVPSPLKVVVTPVDDHPKPGDAPKKNRQYRMTVTVPRDTESQEIDGSIVLKTDHPDAGELVIPVRVVVTGG